MEAWKWTDVRLAAQATSSGMTSACAPAFDLPSGVKVAREAIDPADTPMGKLAAQFAGEAYVVDIPAGLKPDKAAHISGLESGHARIVFRLGKGAALAVHEVHESGSASFVNIDIKFEMAEGAQLTRTIFHRDHEDTARIAASAISAWGGASITQHTLSFGGGLARFETRVAGLGKDLKCELHGAYLLGDKRHCDMTSYIDLAAPGAHIRQSVKGAVGGKARGVFQGKFHVRRPAQLTDAEMRHDAIMLSGTCEIRAKPELEIYADDVACAHGNTVGALDESALFYMRTRGIPAAQARAVLTEAFVAGAFEGMEDNAEFMAQITAWLERNS